MAKANPPPHLRLPKAIEQNRELASVLEEMNFNMFLLWQKLGGGADFIEINKEAIEDNETNINQKITLSKLFDIREQIGSGFPVTIDTTGFTIDTTEQTIDMPEV